jgi:OOP family OmpA-OmpF porin
MIRSIPAAACALVLALTLASLAAVAQTATAAAAKAAESRLVVRSAILSARGLFDGDHLSKSARLHLDALLESASDLDFELALVVPSGPWKVEGKMVDEQSLTPARLAALRAHLAEHGVPAQRIYVESRIDRSLTEPRLVIELVGKPAPQ